MHPSSSRTLNLYRKPIESGDAIMVPRGEGNYASIDEMNKWSAKERHSRDDSVDDSARRLRKNEFQRLHQRY